MISLVKPYPIQNSNEQLILRSLALSFFVLIMNLVFNESPYSSLSLIGLCLSIGLLFLGLSLATKLIFKPIFERNRWLVLYQIIYLSTSIFVILLVNFLFNYYYLKTGEFFEFLLPAIFMSFIIAAVFSFLDFYIALWKNYKKSIQFNETLKLNNGLRSSESHLILLKSDETKEQIKLDVSNIQFVKSAGNYIEIFTEKERVLFRMRLKSFEELTVENDFLFQTHRSYIVNLTKIKKTIGNSHNFSLVLLDCEEMIPVSRGNFKKLIQSPYFNKYRTVG